MDSELKILLLILLSPLISIVLVVTTAILLFRKRNVERFEDKLYKMTNNKFRQQ